MRVLFVTSECAGLSKAGGLGEVSADLPRALRKAGVDVRIMLPAYREAVEQLRAQGATLKWVGTLPSRAGIPACRIAEVVVPDGVPHNGTPTRNGTRNGTLNGLPNGVPLYLVVAPALYDRPGSPYARP